jgi:hypothetical protein
VSDWLQEGADAYERQVQRRLAVNYVDEKDRYLEALAEEIHAVRDELAALEAKYADVQAFEVDHDPDPGTSHRPAGLDGRLFDMGTDEREQWRPPVESLPRRIIDVGTGGRV